MGGSGDNLSYDIIAIDRFTATLAEMSLMLGRISAQLDKIDGKRVSANVTVDKGNALEFLDIFGRRFKVLAAAVTLSSPLMGAAIIGGIGAAFIGIAALAERSNVEVQASFKALWHDVVGETKAASDQLVPQLVRSGQIMDAQMRLLGPSIKAAMAAAGPDIEILTRGLTGMAHNAMPGVVTAVQNSQPVMRGFASLMTQSGTAVSASLTQMSQHAEEMGRNVQSGGAIASGALGIVTSVATTLGDVWAHNASAIDSGIAGLARTFTSFAAGVVPLLSVALALFVAVLNTALVVLKPFAPLLGLIAGGAVAVWAGFKLVAGATAIVRLLAGGIASLGVAFSATATRAGLTIAAMKGVAVQSSVAATAVTAAGESVAAGSISFGVATAAMAAPLGIALAVITAGVGLWALFSGGQDDAAESSRNLQQATEDLTAALVASNGVVDSGVINAIKSDKAFTDAANAGKQFGYSQQTILDALTGNRPAFDAFIANLNNLDKVNHTPGLRAFIDNLVSLKNNLDQSSAAQKSMAAAANASNIALLDSPQYQAVVASTAKALGLSLNDVRSGFLAVMNSGKVVVTDLPAIASAFVGSALAVSTAAQTIKDSFLAADKAVVDAKTGIRDAGRAYRQAGGGVADAQHALAKAADGVVQANQGVADGRHAVETALRSQKDAIAGVTAAELAHVKAQVAERKAQVDLNAAREQAIADLKTMHLQLADQVTSEEQARVGLFDATVTAATSGVTPQNAQKLAGQPITAENEWQIKIALDLISAQNALNNSLDSGTKLRKDVAAADKAGVSGSEVVRSAQDQLRSAQDQVASSAEGVQKAHLAVQDAAYAVQQANLGLVRAQGAVTDAAYAETKAHQGVTDALAAQKTAAEALTVAKRKLRDAELDSNRSLDLNTKAGQRNLGQIKGLVDEINDRGLGAQESYNTKVDDVAAAFGISRQAAEAYLKKVGLLDQNFHYSITAVAKVDPASYQSLFSKSFIARDFGGKMATGGPVVGPGGPRDDQVLLWGSAGEYMQPADSVDYYGVGFMDAVRRKSLPRYATGGAIALMAGLGGAVYQADVNNAIVMGMPHPKPLPEYVPPVVSAGGGGGDTSGIRGTRAANRKIVLDVFSKMFGWSGAGQVSATDFLLMHESGYNNIAQNPTSTARGIFQFLDSTWRGYGVAKTDDPRLQSVAGGRYIRARYGDPIGAASFWRGHHWYDDGGYLMPGNVGFNGTGKPEMVLPPDLTTVMESMYILAKSAYGSPSAPGSTITVSGAGRSSASPGGGTTITQNHYHLTVHTAANTEINLRAQFKRMEIASGVL